MTGPRPGEGQRWVGGGSPEFRPSARDDGGDDAPWGLAYRLILLVTHRKATPDMSSANSPRQVNKI